jgi:peptidoglycan/LPS O-acetylase OafA/YrhL
MVFFVLSGFLVGGQVLRRTRSGTFVLRDYAIERSTRIFIPLVPACLLTVLLQSLTFKSTPEWWLLPINILGLNNVVAPTLSGNAPMWSLAYEIWFYVIAGAAAYLTATRSVAAFVALAFGMLIFSILDARFLAFWCLGAFAFFLPAEPKGAAALGVLLTAVGIITFEFSSASKSFASIAYLPPAASETLICAGTALLLPMMCSAEASSALAFFRRSIEYLSKISYTLYLVHYPINTALEKILPKSPDISFAGTVQFAARLLVIFVCVHGLYLAFEANTPKIRRWIRSAMSDPGYAANA